jgi:hypothetical protein
MLRPEDSKLRWENSWRMERRSSECTGNNLTGIL